MTTAWTYLDNLTRELNALDQDYQRAHQKQLDRARDLRAGKGRIPPWKDREKMAKQCEQKAARIVLKRAVIAVGLSSLSDSAEVPDARERIKRAVEAMAQAPIVANDSRDGPNQTKLNALVTRYQGVVNYLPQPKQGITYEARIAKGREAAAVALGTTSTALTSDQMISYAEARMEEICRQLSPQEYAAANTAISAYNASVSSGVSLPAAYATACRQLDEARAGSGFNRGSEGMEHYALAR